MKDGIDLGVKPSDRWKGAMLSPMKPEGEPSDEKQFPVLHYCGPEELDLPDEGRMTVCFKKVSETSSTRSDGSHWYECDLEIHCICEVEDKDEEMGTPSRRNNEAESALDTIAEALRRAHEKEEEDEGENGNGNGNGEY